ncbi:acetyl-CoA synthetase-like protein [Corynespora cassiicola Philippines]|uniref:Acetyl-CoA synthetase-like protein n=1 Tax=Corynespora cassiicola Philippines TaxID=1448308 RepID=A0A2T2NPK9_CORCC|nr:acetyl-CoA synthetase-like protein [Corynespora cassiicola Philippines]
MYGPTEGTGGATIARLKPGQPVTIGRPNPTSRVYILGRCGRLMPPGAIGEIHIAGAQVAIGYANLPEETAARFVPDTVCPDLGEKMYRTGDEGYWDENGEVVCLGRRDRQVKMRGFRLDLDDLEARIIKALPEIKAAALTKSERGDTLVAMLQPASLQQEVVREAMVNKLPRQAVPSVIACVDEFPMTRAGKVDVKAIAATLAGH